MPSYNPNNLRWIEGNESDAAVGQGGRVVQFVAGGALNLGDVVCVTGVRTVNKSTASATHTARIGIVVGGDALQRNVHTDTTLYGANVLAAATGQNVYVCVQGVAVVVTDSAITAGTTIAPSTTTAGQVRAANLITASVTAPTITAPTITASVNAGATAVTSTAANGSIITASASAPTATAPAATVTGDGFSRILGIMLDTTTGAGQTGLAVIALA